MKQSDVGQQGAEADGIDQRGAAHEELDRWPGHIGYNGVKDHAGFCQACRAGSAYRQ